MLSDTIGVTLGTLTLRSSALTPPSDKELVCDVVPLPARSTIFDAGQARQPASTSRSRVEVESGCNCVACYHPLRGFRARSGTVTLGKETPDSEPLAIPCGGCLGCRTDRARGWALRCHLEMQSHRSAVFTTLTYADDQLPPTLEKRHLQLWLKRLRKAKRGGIRFFASGEYGERTARPHYHALLYGCSEADASLIQDLWGKGHCRTEGVTPARIAYVAGYCQKKIGYRMEGGERVDPETGEVYEWQPPFIQMSRRPGIGANAKQWPESWRMHAVHNGRPIPVPRYLHQAWKDNASPTATEETEHEKSLLKLTRNRDLSYSSLQASEQVAAAKHELRSARRRLD